MVQQASAWLGVDDNWFNTFIENIGNIVFWGLNIWGAIQGIYGLFRKLKFGRWSAAEV
jgi:hypothetical protein